MAQGFPPRDNSEDPSGPTLAGNSLPRNPTQTHQNRQVPEGWGGGAQLGPQRFRSFGSDSGGDQAGFRTFEARSAWSHQEGSVAIFPA